MKELEDEIMEMVLTNSINGDDCRFGRECPDYNLCCRELYFECMKYYDYLEFYLGRVG